MEKIADKTDQTAEFFGIYFYEALYFPTPIS